MTSKFLKKSSSPNFFGSFRQGALLALTCTVFSASSGLSGDWPQWRGSNQDEKSTETGLLQSWPANGPTKTWMFTNAGIGYSGPAVVGDHLFILGGRGGQEQLIAISTKDGTEAWATNIGDVYENGWGDGPRGTPSVDGDHVYALGAQGNLICVQKNNGKIVWKVSLTKDFGGGTPNWGYTESVLVDGNRVLATPGGKKGAVIALDKSNGKLLWRSEDFTDEAQYSSILSVSHNGKHQYVQLTQQSVVGLDAANGKVLWKAEWPGRTAVIPTPIYNNGYVYVTSGYGVGCKLLKLNDDSSGVTEVYYNRNMKNHHGGVILLDGHVFGYSDGVGWLCQNLLTGEEVWSNKEDLGKGAISYADGRFYCLEEGKGEVVLIEASTTGWKEQGRFTLEPQTKIRSSRGKVWTHPVISNGKLYLRDQDILISYDIKK